jgi:predicted type IV restriction endonuclease
VHILRALSRKNPNFLERLSQQVPSRTRNHIASRPEAVYPHRPELAEYTVELEKGWYLGTNIANREKLRILEKACEVEGLTFGKDLKIVLPNAG